MKTISLRILVIASLCGWATLVGPVAGWIHDRFFEQPFLSYPDQPFKVLDAPVMQGGTIKVHVNRCSADDHPRLYPVSHVLDAAAAPVPDVRLSSTTVTVYPGCKPSDLLFVIPYDTPPGFYKIAGYSEPTGTVRTFSVTWESAEFEVIQGAKP